MLVIIEGGRGRKSGGNMNANVAAHKDSSDHATIKPLPHKRILKRTLNRLESSQVLYVAYVVVV